MRAALAAISTLLLFPASSVAQSINICQTGRLVAGADRHAQGQQGTGGHTLAIYYAVPANIPYDSAVLERIKQAAGDIQGWYQCATGGMTWEFAAQETVEVYHAQHERQYYVGNGNWWGSLPAEMSSAGLPIGTPSMIAAIWAQGAGWWAGAAQGCNGECGTALLGVELFPEFNNPDFSGGACPGGSGGAAFPCTPEGAFAHELGHTLGLPHPLDVPATTAVAFHSVMQTHWNYPDFAAAAERPWGFLSIEPKVLLKSPFMKWGLSLTQTHADCDVVNLPITGPKPKAAYTIDSEAPSTTFHGTDVSIGGSYTYWTFGDGDASDQKDVVHSYATPGVHTVTLRSMANNAMTDRTSNPLALGASPDCSMRPNPFTTSSAITIRLKHEGPVRLCVQDVTGRRVRTMAATACGLDVWAAVWDGRGEDGRDVAAGIYFLRALGQGTSFPNKLVRLR